MRIYEAVTNRLHNEWRGHQLLQRQIVNYNIVCRFNAKSPAEANRFASGLCVPGSSTTFGKLSRQFMLRQTTIILGRMRLHKIRLAGGERRSVTGPNVQIIIYISAAMKRGQAGSKGKDVTNLPRIRVRLPMNEYLDRFEDASSVEMTAPFEDIAQRAALQTGVECNLEHIVGLNREEIEETLVERAFCRIMRSAFAEMLALEEAGVGQIGVVGFEELLLNLAVPIVFPQALSLIQRSEASNTINAIEKVRTFIEDNAGEVIELSTVARDLGISMRVLQLRFQREFGFSPRDYILECRLARARSLLLGGGALDSVSSIALASGFSDLSHFSAKYKDKFGELPSETLRLARS